MYLTEYSLPAFCMIVSIQVRYDVTADNASETTPPNLMHLVIALIL